MANRMYERKKDSLISPQRQLSDQNYTAGSVQDDLKWPSDSQLSNIMAIQYANGRGRYIPRPEAVYIAIFYYL